MIVSVVVSEDTPMADEAEEAFVDMLREDDCFDADTISDSEMLSERYEEPGMRRLADGMLQLAEECTRGTYEGRPSVTELHARLRDLLAEHSSGEADLVMNSSAMA